MKKITLAIIFILSSLFGFGQNLIQDGTFSTQTGSITGSTTPWAGFNSQIRGSGAAEDPSVGNGNNGEASIFQLVTVTPGDTYNFSFDYKWISGSGNYNLTVRIKDNLADGKPNLDITGGTSSDGFTLDTTTDTWFRDNTFSVTIPSGVTEIRVLFYKGNGNRPVRIDNISLEKAATASINEVESINFNISPNPVSTELFISSSEDIDKIEVYNIVGQKITSKMLNTSTNSIDVSSLSKGVYILKTYQGTKVGSKKFIKN